MRIYTVRKREGYYLGRYYEPTWTRRGPTVEPTPPIDMRGIEWEILEEYWDYLWRLGEYTFSGVYVWERAAPEGYINLERFVEYHYLKLWPKYRRLWQVVGAMHWGFLTKEVMVRPIGFPLTPETETVFKDLVIMRYNEALWWGKVLHRAASGMWAIELHRWIGRHLMFERRGPGIAKRYQDSWNFGMSWWEWRDIAGRVHLYLWGEADVTYIGLATKHTETLYSVKVLEP